jgi:hypothetical protein
MTSTPAWALGRDSFKRHDDASEQMNIDGRATGTPEVLWNGTGASDTGGDWTAGNTGSETAGSMHSGTNGWDTGVITDGNKTRFNNGSTVDIDGGYAELRFWIQPKAFPATSPPKVGWLDGSNTLIGSRLRIDDYTENMDLDVWQQVAIPISDFGLTADVQKLEFKYLNVDGQQYWFDDIEIIPIGNGPYRFEFEAPDTNTRYHISMIVLMVSAPKTGWTSTAFGAIAGGISQGLILRQKRKSDTEVLWKFVTKNNAGLFGYYHPQDEIVFADDEMLVGFMVKPGKASIVVTDDEVLQFVVRDDLSSITSIRAYAHFGVEVVS